MKLMKMLMGEDLTGARRQLQYWYAGYALFMFVLALVKMVDDRWEVAGYMLLIVLLVMNLMKNNQTLHEYRILTDQGEENRRRMMEHIEFLHECMHAERDGRTPDAPEGPQ